MAIVTKKPLSRNNSAGMYVAPVGAGSATGRHEPDNMRRFCSVNIAERNRQQGASLIDLMIATTVLAIIVSLAVVNISAAREGMRLSSSAQIRRAYLDKARLSAIRCHCPTTVTISSTGGYTVSAPLKSATTETVNFPLEPNVNLQGLT